MTTLAPKRPNTEKPDRLIYLSSPYSHEDRDMRHYRYRANMLTVAHYLHKGIYLFSPILHAHPIACYDDLGSADEWLRFDCAVLDRCDEMWVLMLPGWEQSYGVNFEIRHCHVAGVRVYYIDPHFEGISNDFVDFGGPNGRT